MKFDNAGFVSRWHHTSSTYTVCYGHEVHVGNGFLAHRTIVEAWRSPKIKGRDGRRGVDRIAAKAEELARILNNAKLAVQEATLPANSLAQAKKRLRRLAQEMVRQIDV